MHYIQFDELKSVLTQILENRDFEKKKATLIARVFAESTLDGYHSHGVNRFGLFLSLVDKGIIKQNQQAEKIFSLGAFERWDGQAGPGIVNASLCMDSAIRLAKEKGMATISLRNTNHWMRGGTYGWQAVEAGCMAICFTNTKANMPPWGGKDARTGNNPLIIAVPRESGHIVLDISMSQFSYGKMTNYARQNKKLPFLGGYNEKDELTDDPTEILKTERALPMGFWKGAGLSLMLDLMAATLSEGLSTAEVSNEYESNLSQIFMCWDTRQLAGENYKKMIDDIVQHYCSAAPIDGYKEIYFPGQQSLQRRQQYLNEGIPIDDEIWQEIQNYHKHS